MELLNNEFMPNKICEDRTARGVAVYNFAFASGASLQGQKPYTEFGADS